MRIYTGDDSVEVVESSSKIEKALAVYGRVAGVIELLTFLYMVSLIAANSDHPTALRFATITLAAGVAIDLLWIASRPD